MSVSIMIAIKSKESCVKSSQLTATKSWGQDKYSTYTPINVSNHIYWVEILAFE